MHSQVIDSNMIQQRGVNATLFRNFLIDTVRKLPRNSIVVLDNASIHTAEIIVECWSMLETAFAVTHLFLPTYSPFLNPIELAFNSMKTRIRGMELHSREELKRAIDDSLQISPEEAKSYYAHSAKFYQRCLLGLPFTGKPLAPELEEEKRD